MNDKKCLIVGASHAGTSLALQLRKEGWQGKIQLLSAEHELPYHRPPLTKDLLAGKKQLDGIRLRPQKMFDDNEINLSLGAEVSFVNPEQNSVRLIDGSELNYDKLALCTGSTVTRLALLEEHKNVFYIRNAEDTITLRKLLQKDKKAVIIGGGYIGLEAASVLASCGLEVIVLEMEQRILQRVACGQLAEFVHHMHRVNGVDIRCSTTIEAVNSSGNQTRLLCSDGNEIVADIIVVGIGVKPETALAQQAGLALDNGIAVDEFGQTSRQNIFAAGDCCSHPSALFGRRIRLESVQNANDQARVAAANICGKQQAYNLVPWFWSEQYNARIQLAGLNESYDQLVVRGDLRGDVNEDLQRDFGDHAGFSLFYLREGRLIAADCVNRPREFLVSKQLIQNETMVNSDKMADENVEPKNFADPL